MPEFRKLYSDVKINLLLAIDRVKKARRQIKISMIGEQTGYDALGKNEQYEVYSTHDDFQTNIREALDEAEDLESWLEMILSDMEEENEDAD